MHIAMQSIHVCTLSKCSTGFLVNIIYIHTLINGARAAPFSHPYSHFYLHTCSHFLYAPGVGKQEGQGEGSMRGRGQAARGHAVVGALYLQSSLPPLPSTLRPFHSFFSPSIIHSLCPCAWSVSKPEVICKIISSWILVHNRP